MHLCIQKTSIIALAHSQNCQCVFVDLLGFTCHTAVQLPEDIASLDIHREGGGIAVGVNAHDQAGRRSDVCCKGGNQNCTTVSISSG